MDGRRARGRTGGLLSHKAAGGCLRPGGRCAHTGRRAADLWGAPSRRRQVSAEDAGTACTAGRWSCSSTDEGWRRVASVVKCGRVEGTLWGNGAHLAVADLFAHVDIPGGQRRARAQHRRRASGCSCRAPAATTPWQQRRVRVGAEYSVFFCLDAVLTRRDRSRGWAARCTPWRQSTSAGARLAPALAIWARGGVGGRAQRPPTNCWCVKPAVI